MTETIATAILDQVRDDGRDGDSYIVLPAGFGPVDLSGSSSVGTSGHDERRDVKLARRSNGRPVLKIARHIKPGDIPALCESLGLLIESGMDVVVCDVKDVVKPSAVTVETLARLQLTARRLGSSIQLRHVSPELGALIGFMGLRDVFAPGDRWINETA